MSVDVLFFGAHPDDVEWGMGGTALLLHDKGISFAIIDLSDGGMGSRGTAEGRKNEAIQAAGFLGAVSRDCLGMPDCGIVDSPENRKITARAIRKHRPVLVVAPFWEDRHPDHAATGLLVRNSRLYCGLTKLDHADPPHKPGAFLYYPLHQFEQPSYVVHTSTVFAAKLDLLRLHRSQFAKTAEEFGVIAQGVGDYLFALESRDRYYGSLAGVKFGEPLVADRPMRLSGLDDILPFVG